tara:strand:- start:227 stop:673 length:447 start_codon:yes stop_codon:yes gene_type:complete
MARKHPTPQPTPPKVGDLVEGLIAQTIASIHLSVLVLNEPKPGTPKVDWFKATYHIAGRELTDCLHVLNQYTKHSLRAKHYRVKGIMAKALEGLSSIDMDKAKRITNHRFVDMVQTLTRFLEDSHIAMMDGEFLEPILDAGSEKNISH